MHMNLHEASDLLAEGRSIERELDTAIGAALIEPLRSRREAPAYFGPIEDDAALEGLDLLSGAYL